MVGNRGVILVHVLILTMLLAWLASMFLSAVLSRQINAKQSVTSNEIRSSMSAAMTQVSLCLENQGFPRQPAAPGTAMNCTYDSAALSNCLGAPAKVNGREFKACVSLTPNTPPCRVVVKFAAPGDSVSGVACP